MSTTVVPEGKTGEGGTARGEHGKIMSAFGIFTIVVIIVLIGITALFATNAIFFERIRDGSCAKISKNEADILYWTNVVLAVIAGLLALIAIIMLFVYWKKPEYKEKYLGKYVSPTAYTAAKQRAAGAAKGAVAGYMGANVLSKGVPAANLPPVVNPVANPLTV